MEQRVQRVIQRLFLAARIVVLVEMERQRGDGLRQNPDASVYRRHLHGGALIHGLPGSGAAEKEGIRAAVQLIRGLVPRPEQLAENTHMNKRPLSS